MCFYNDGEYATIWRESDPRARKQYKCYECGGTIIVGEKYRCVFTVFEGDAGTYRTCSRCVRLRDAIREVEIAAGCSASESQPSLGGLYDEVSESDGWQHYADQYARLHPGEYIRWPIGLDKDQLANDYENYYCETWGHNAPDEAVMIGGEAGGA